MSLEEMSAESAFATKGAATRHACKNLLGADHTLNSSKWGKNVRLNLLESYTKTFMEMIDPMKTSSLSNRMFPRTTNQSLPVSGMVKP